MVLLHHQVSSRKRPSSSFIPPFPPPKIPKSSSSAAAAATTTATSAADNINSRRQSNEDAETLIEKMVAVLAEAGCTLVNPSGPPCLPSDPHKLRRHLQSVFSSTSDGCSLRSDFIDGFSSYIRLPQNLHRVLISSGSTRGDSLVRSLLLVPSIQLDLQNILLEKIPEYFDTNMDNSGTSSSSSLEDDVARLILNHFRWLDFLVDPTAFTEKLMQVLSISPLHLKKEIIGSLPEIIGDQNNNSAVVDSLQQMLQEDSAIIVPVLDSFSSFNLDNQLQEQVITIALSFIRTIDAKHMPYLLRFLVLSATPGNVRRVISQIREHLKFMGVSNSSAMQRNKLKGKSLVDNSEASILGALKSSLRFKNILCQEILKELKNLERPSDHKVIDIWLLMLIYMNGESLQKSVEKIFKSKIIEGCIQEYMIDQCLCGNKDLVQDYFHSFLSLSEYLLACKEKNAREFGIHMYSRLFEEFKDTCSRQEVLGALVTHVGSGIGYEVSSAMEAMVLLASKYSREMITLSCHINGILDYLEGFSVENLHKVYDVFSHLVLSARSSVDSLGSSIANDLLMIVRKQVSSPDLKYKKMGIIGTMKIVSCLGDAADNSTSLSSSQKTNCEEALELLKASLASCKYFPLPLILFYDELAMTLMHKSLQPEIMEWIGKHVGEFESVYLSDLEGGQLPIKDLYCGLEGELWMNLDGDISPICLNILPLASSSLQSASSLQILPTHFLVLSVIERLANKGSLGGIDALLGCPLHLPSSKYFSETAWQSLTGKQKQIVCLSLYYAANWIRELLNAFCTQVAGRFECTSQATKEEITAKLLKRLRNLVFLESLLNNCLQRFSLSLPDLHVESSGSSLSNQPSHMGHAEKKMEHKKTHDSISSNNKKRLKKTLTNSNLNDKCRQPTIMEVLRKAGAITSPEASNEDSPGLSSKSRASESADYHTSETYEEVNVEISAVGKVLEAQRFKFRPLLVDCFSILTFSKNQNTCCADPAAELPLHLYLLRDLHCKLDYFAPPTKQFFPRCSSAPPGLNRVSVNEFLKKIISVFPCLKNQYDAVVYNREDGAETCQEHWKVQSASAGNPDIAKFVLSKSLVFTLLFKEILHCFSKMLNILDIQKDEAVLLDLLGAFQPIRILDSIFAGIQPSPSPGSLEYLYCGAFSYVESVLDTACSFSFVLASEALLSLESIVKLVQKFVNNFEKKAKGVCKEFTQRLLPTLRTKLGTSAHRLLRHNWEDENLEGGWKKSGEMVQRILHICLENSDCTSDLLDDLACSILPQVPMCKTQAKDNPHGFPTLCSGTFVVWYRVLNEQNIAILNKLVKEVFHFDKPRAGGHHETVVKILIKLQQSVNVVVSLVNMCKSHDKVTVHAMAVKYGGKFIDSFLKVFDFLQTHFGMHSELIIQLVKELQKATRTIQTLCSEAKGSKQTVITSNIPSTKRSMERFLFCVKALLHTTSSGSSFWMGNLKHKDLMGQVVSSQAYVIQNDSVEDNSVEVNEENFNDVAGEEEEKRNESALSDESS